MCFIVPKEEPTFGELARDFHHSHVNEVRERSARLAAEERAERLAARLGQEQADVIIAQAPRTRSREASPPDSPRRPKLEWSPSRAKELLRLPTFGRKGSR